MTKYWVLLSLVQYLCLSVITRKLRREILLLKRDVRFWMDSAADEKQLRKYGQ